MVPSNPRRRVLVQAVAVALPLLIYGLSVGPALLLIADQPSLEPILMVYRPIFFLSEEISWVGDALDWYLAEVCGVPARARHRRP